MSMYTYIGIQTQIKPGRNIHQIDLGRGGGAYNSIKMRLSCCVLCGYYLQALILCFMNNQQLAIQSGTLTVMF